MYTIEENQKDGFCNVVLCDTDAKTSATLTPARGGMLTSFCLDGHEYIYLNTDNYYTNERPRCAMPILFPCCGRTEDETYTWNGKEYPMTIHGIVHTISWTVTAHSTENGASVTLTRRSDEETRKLYPFDFELNFTYTLRGSTLTLHQEYRNTGSEAMPYNFGFHPYFKVSRLENARVDVIAETKAMPADPGKLAPFTPGTVTLPRECAKDSILFGGVKDRFILTDTETGRRATVHFDDNFHYGMLWNLPGMEPDDNFICVEPWNGIPNSLRTGTYELLEAGSARTAELSIEIA